MTTLKFWGSTEVMVRRPPFTELLKQFTAAIILTAFRVIAVDPKGGFLDEAVNAKLLLLQKKVDLAVKRGRDHQQCLLFLFKKRRDARDSLT